MRRGTIFVVLLVVAAGVIIGASQFLGAQPAVEIRVAVDPLAEAWARQAINALNATQPVIGTRRVQFRLEVIDDLDVWRGTPNWTPASHPAAWIAASSVSVNYAIGDGLPLHIAAPALARTPLVWGGFATRISVATDGAPLDWPAVAAAAALDSWQALGGESSWGFVQLAIDQPDRKIGGMAALLTGAAAFNQTTTPAANVLSSQQFRNWLLPVVSAVPKNLTGGAAAGMAVGPSRAQIGLFPELQWLTNLSGMLAREDVELAYPAYTFVLDFPLARWQDAQTSAEQQGAVDLLRDWLTGAAQQAGLTAFGLRPAAGQPTQADALFAAGLAHGLLLNPPLDQVVQAPPRADMERLIQWFVQNQ